MDNISKAVPIPVQSPAVSDMASLLLAAQAQVAQSQIIHSAIGHSPIVQTNIAQSPVAQPKSFQPDLPESEFLNLSFDQLNQVSVRASRSNQTQMQVETKEALEVKSKENFLQMPFERLMRLPVRMATLGKNDKDKQIKDAEEVTSNPTSINFQSIPVFSTQALESVVSYNTNVENTSTKTATDTSTTTTTTTTDNNVLPIAPSPLPLPFRLAHFLVTANNIGDTLSVLVRNDNNTFTLKYVLPINSPNDVVVADLNKDGLADIIGISQSGTLLVALGTGIGTFGVPISRSVGLSYQSITVGDFNGDNKPDLALVRLNNLIQILLGDGSGGFGSGTTFVYGGSSHSIVSADFNGDNALDLVVTDEVTDTIIIFLGTGTGSFGGGTSFPVGSFPWNLAVGDFNKDGTPDIAVTNINSNTVGVLLGNGFGGFGTMTSFLVGTNPRGLAVADLNGDGNLDIVVTNRDDNTVSILFGLGTGGFSPITTFPVGINPIDVAIADYNADRIPDLAISNEGTNDVSIFLGNGDGTFYPSANYLVGEDPIVIAAGVLPAGISGFPINLGLKNINTNELITLNISGIPLDWTLNEGVNNLDGSWSIQTSAPELLTVTTNFDFVGARVLTVDMNWVSINGDIEHLCIKDNIEAYAADSAIFALPNDNLTGSNNSDIFVISKSNALVQDKIFNFDTTLDKIDLIGFETLHDFSDLIIENDIYGNALIQLLDNNQSILLSGIDANEITDNNFLFNITPHTINNGIIDIGVGSIMPFNGIFENNGTVYVEGILRVEGDITGVGKIILGSSGTLELEGHLGQDIIFETSNITLPILEANQIA